MTFSDACALIEPLLSGSARRAIVADLANAPTMRESLLRLRDSMRSNAWKADDRVVGLGRVVKEFDAATRAEGFHVLHDWDGKADTVLDDTIPLDVLHYVMAHRGADPPDAAAIFVLLDYYFVHVLALLSVRVWDDGDADQNLDRLNALLRDLQGPDGSGQPFVNDAATLILIATSHFEAVEIGYERLLDRVRTLDERHQTNIAIGHAVSMGSHLRFGFQATYGRDTVVMRDDNVADYPWLCFALAASMRAYHRRRDARDEGLALERVVEAIVCGLSADPRAFLGQAPASLSSVDADRTEFARHFLAHRDELLDAFESYRPGEQTYSPLSFFFNFSHNILKGTIVDAALRGRAWDVSFDDLLTGGPRDTARSALKTELAQTLMRYARANPDRIRGRLMPVIVYDPATGREAFTAALKKMRDSDS
jgi:hypothetical protein